MQFREDLFEVLTSRGIQLIEEGRCHVLGLSEILQEFRHNTLLLKNIRETHEGRVPLALNNERGKRGPTIIGFL